LPSLLKRLYKDFSDYFILPKVNKKIARFIDKNHYDAVLVHGDQFVQSPYILRFLKTPSLYYCQEYLRIAYEKELNAFENFSFINRIYEKINRKIRKKIDYRNAISATEIQVNSVFSKINIQNAYKRNVEINYLGVNNNIFKSRSKKRKNYLLFVGEKTETKGYKLLEEAVKMIDKDKRPEIITTNLVFQKNIINDIRLSKLYSQAIATICLGNAEPFGLSALESIACKTPVIAVNNGGYKEIVNNNKTGFLIRRDVYELKHKILYLINNPNIFNFNDLKINKILKKFNWKSHVNLVNVAIHKVTSKKILISGQDSGGFGGSENFIYSLLKSLSLKGIDISISVVKHGAFEKFLRNNDVIPNTVPYRMDLLGHIKGLIKFIIFYPHFFIINFAESIKYKKSGIKTVIITGFSDKLTLSLISRLLGFKIIWLEYAPLEPVYKRNFGIPKIFYEISLNFVDQIIVPTNFMFNYFSNKYPKFSKKLVKIPCGIEVLNKNKLEKVLSYKDIFKKRLKLSNKIIIGMVSRIEKGKGQDTLIKTAAILKNKITNFIVLIIGKGDTKELRNLINKYNLKKEVKLLGFKKDIYSYISIFDVFVFPTEWELEGFGLVSLEAMMLKVPLITSGIAPVKEVVGNAAIISDTNPDKLAKNIIKLLKDKQLRKKLTERGFKRVCDLYSIEKISQKYLEII